MFFFAGSGISRDSRPPSAETVARATARRMLPGAGDADISLRARVQPELLDETLIDATGDRRCLGVPGGRRRWDEVSSGCERYRAMASRAGNRLNEVGEWVGILANRFERAVRVVEGRIGRWHQDAASRRSSPSGDRADRPW